MDPIVSMPGDGERFERENWTLTIRIEEPQLSVIEIEFDDTFTVGNETRRAGPGTLLAAPPGARHGFRSAGGKARVLNFHAPDAGFADSIRSF